MSSFPQGRSRSWKTSLGLSPHPRCRAAEGTPGPAGANDVPSKPAPGERVAPASSPRHARGPGPALEPGPRGLPAVHAQCPSPRRGARGACGRHPSRACVRAPEFGFAARSGLAGAGHGALGWKVTGAGQCPVPRAPAPCCWPRAGVGAAHTSPRSHLLHRRLLILLSWPSDQTVTGEVEGHCPSWPAMPPFR